MARTTRRAHPTQAPTDVARVMHTEFGRLLSEVAEIACMSLNAAGLAIGTDTAQVLIANTVNYLINGEFKSKTTAEVAFTADDHDIAADADAVQEAVYVLSLQADGTPVLTMGEIASGAGNAEVPAPPEDEAVIGHVRIAVDAGATPFDAGSDALSAGHLTVTYTDAAFVHPGTHARSITATR